MNFFPEKIIFKKFHHYITIILIKIYLLPIIKINKIEYYL